jgi:hypothetical protein
MDGSRAEAQLCRYFGRSPALSEKSDHLDLTAAQALSCRVLMLHDDLVWVQKTHGCTRAFHASAWRLFVLPVKLHHSLKSPLCSWVSITLPKKQLKLPGDHQAVRDSRQLK